MLSSSLIISTYNQPEALALCLESILFQKTKPGEVIIADDGSSADTKKVVDAFSRIAPFPVKHVWQEDQGFRLAMIRNKAIAAATGEYIVQLDGDIILHRYLIQDHLRFAKENCFVRASRIYLDEQLTHQMIRDKISRVRIVQRGVSNKTSGIRFPPAWPLFEDNYKNKGDERYEIHGCNMAFWRKDAIAVNGYNEDFVGWGPEDKEFVARLLNAGRVKKFLKLGAIAFHLYHPERSKSNLPENERKKDAAISLQYTFCNNGINKYLI